MRVQPWLVVLVLAGTLVDVDHAGGFEPTVMAVTGGTGKYSAARGQARVTRATAADRADVGYRFTITLTD